MCDECEMGYSIFGACIRTKVMEGLPYFNLGHVTLTTPSTGGQFVTHWLVHVILKVRILTLAITMTWRRSRNFKMGVHHMIKSTAFEWSIFSELATYLASFSMTYLATSLKFAKFSDAERTATH